VMLQVLGGRLQLFFEPKNQIPNAWGFDLLKVIKCSVISIVILFFLKVVFSPTFFSFEVLSFFCHPIVLVNIHNFLNF